MKFATKPQYTQVLVWLIWVIVLLVFMHIPEGNPDVSNSERPVLMGIITPHRRDGPLFPWRYRLRVIIRDDVACFSEPIIALYEQLVGPNWLYAAR